MTCIKVRKSRIIGRKENWLWHIWSHTHMVLGHLVPNLLVPLDKWSPTNSVSMGKWSTKNLEYSVCPGGQAVGIQKKGDQIGWGPFIHGGPNFWGPFFHDDWIWLGLFVQGTLYWILISIVIWGCYSQNDRFVQNCNQGLLWYHIRSEIPPRATFVTKILVEVTE